MRTVLSLVVLALVLWASCTVKLGRLTLAEHVDRIGETDEAKALLAGARSKIAPALEDMKTRLFGEYVEAPTSDSRRPPERRDRSRPRDEPPRTAKALPREETPPTKLPRSEPTKPPPSERPAVLSAAEPAARPSTAEASRLPGSRRGAH
jgi:hypothetical protein